MVKKTFLPEYFKTTDFKYLYRVYGMRPGAIKLLGLKLLQEGLSIKDVSTILSSSPNKIKEWLDVFDKVDIYTFLGEGGLVGKISLSGPMTSEEIEKDKTIEVDLKQPLSQKEKTNDIDLEDIKSLLAQNVKKKEIARRLGISLYTLRGYMRDLGLNVSRNKIFPHQVEEVLQKAQKGVKIQEIASEYGASKGTIYRIVKEKGQNLVSRESVDLEKEDIQKIKEHVEKGFSKQKIAAIFKMNPNRLRAILRENAIDSQRNLQKLNRGQLSVVKQRASDNVPFEEIAKEFAITLPTLKRYIKSLGFPTPEVKKRIAKKEETLTLYRCGFRKEDIMKEVGISEATFYLYLNAAPGSFENTDFKALYSQNRRRVRAERVKALKLLQEGLSFEKVSKEMGVSTKTIREWVDLFKRGGIEVLMAKHPNTSIVERLDYSRHKLNSKDIKTLKDLLDQSIEKKEIAERLGISATSLRMYMKAMGVGKSKTKILSERTKDILEKSNEGASIKEIAKDYGVSTNAIYTALRNAGYPRAPKGLVEKDISKIEQYIGEGHPKQHIAKFLGVDITTLRKFLQKNPIDSPRRAQKLTKQQITLIGVRVQEGVPASSILKEMKISIGTLRKHMKEIGIFQKSPRKAQKKAKMDQTLNLLKQRVDREEIMKQVGISIGSLYNYMKELGVSFEDSPLGKSYGRKLDPETLNQLRDLLNKGKTGGEIFKELGVSGSTVYNYRKKWGIKPFTHMERMEEFEDQIHQCLREKMSIPKIAKRLEIKESSLRTYIRHKGIDVSKKGFKEEDFQKYMNLRRQGKSKMEILQQMDTSPSLFYKYCKKEGIDLSKL